MKISILSVFPELYETFLHTSLVARAQQQSLVSIETKSFFSCVKPKERIDTPTFGTGAGMVIRPDVVQAAVEGQEELHGKAFRIFFSPQGKKLNQNMLRHLYTRLQDVDHLMLVAARYEGMDERVERHYADEVISVGDFVVLGGDTPAMLFLEGLLRLIPGVVGKQESVEKESFSGPFLDYPEYGAPVEWQGMQVPDIIRSGNHGAVQAWRQEQAVKKTVKHHFSWIQKSQVNEEEKAAVRQALPAHYMALLHGDVLIGKEKKPGTTSVTSIDIHDIARSSMTYGFKEFSVVTPLVDQQRMVEKILSFWKGEAGQLYNKVRHKALDRVVVRESLDEVVAAIESKEGAPPIIIATSACDMSDESRIISFHDQEKVWETGRPVLILFGTGQGLSPECIDRCDYILLPLKGFGKYNHLSVRSAAAIVFDRWLGSNEKIE
jgi:tRNA (guanine37-N1)-methyltransferase